MCYMQSVGSRTNTFGHCKAVDPRHFGVDPDPGIHVSDH
jgi:hypothetical protein